MLSSGLRRCARRAWQVPAVMLVLAGLLLVQPGALAQVRDPATEGYRVFNLALSYLDRGKFARCLDVIDQAAADEALLAREPALTALRVDALVGAGRYLEAVAQASTALALIESRTATVYPDTSSGVDSVLYHLRAAMPTRLRVAKIQALIRLERTDEAIALLTSTDWEWSRFPQFFLRNGLLLVNAMLALGRLQDAETLIGRIEVTISALNWWLNLHPVARPSAALAETIRSLSEGNVRMVRGEIELRKRNYAAALEHIAQADQALARTAGAADDTRIRLAADRVFALNRLGRFADGVARIPPSGFESIVKRDADSVSNSRLMADLGYAYLAVGRPDDADTLWSALIDTLERRRGSVAVSAEARREIASNWLSHYRWLASLKLRSGRVSEAFDLSERSKGRSLLETITAGNADDSPFLPAEHRTALRELSSRIAELDASIVVATDPRAQRELRREKEGARDELAGLRDRLLREYPRYAAVSRITALARAPEGLIPADAAFISYLIIPPDERAGSELRSRLWAFVLRGTAAPVAVDLGPADEIDKQVTQFQQRLSSGEAVRQAMRGRRAAGPLAVAPKGGAEMSTAERGTMAAALSRSLARRLIEPLLDKLEGARQLIISPDGALSLLPFEALRLGDSLLIERFDVGYVQSLSILNLLRQRQVEYQAIRRRDLFAMGAPIYMASDPAPAPVPARALPAQLSANPAEPVAGRSTRAAELSRNFFASLSGNLQNLPGTEDEILAIARLFPDGETFLGPEATEAKLLSLNRERRLEQYRYLHFAAHGYLNTEVPDLSALILGQVKRAPDTDGFITAAKWMTYSVKSDLLVLSACETGLGKIVLGEGILGLPYALYVAGNRSTALSLWPVDDEGTAFFMQQFYGALRAGQGHAQAMSRAKRDMLLHPEYRDPFFWAPFIVYGP